MKALLTTMKLKPIRASAEASLRTSSQAPASGITALDNSEGFSQTAAEFSDTIGLALSEITTEDSLSSQLTAQIQRLDSKASKYANRSLDFCHQKKAWTCTRTEARLISLAWDCAERVYDDAAAEEQAGSEVKVEFSIPSSTYASMKATRFTKYTPDPAIEVDSPSYLIIAVRGSASKYDHMVNLNTEPRDASKLFVTGSRSAGSCTVALELYAHAGFLNATIKLLPQILDRVSKHLKANLTANIIFTGHSAGGAVATLLHLAVLSRFASAVPDAAFSCITFGAPPSVKLSSEKDKMALKQLARRSQTLNFINEYDLVGRLDNNYSRSMALLYKLLDTQAPESSPSTQREDIADVHQTTWQCPPPELQHVGELVVLRVEVPTFGPGSSNVLQTTSSKLSAWEVTAAGLSELVFCRLTVHKREAYKSRIDLLKNGFFNRQNGWAST